MKTLLVIRHAKAETGFGLKDFDRSLTSRGSNDAPAMAKKIAEKKINIDAFISSPAKRTTQTAELFCNTFHKKAADILFKNELYNAPAGTYVEVIQNIKDNFDTVAIFGHNPGVTDFANSLIKEVKIDIMPTCAVFAVTANIKSWKEFAATEKQFLFFDYPKNI